MFDVSVQRLHKIFPGGVKAVDNVSFNLEREKTITLLGHSGSGKSTVLRCIAGLETPTSGEIYIQNNQVFNSEIKINVPCEKRELGMVFQSYAIWPHLNVYENIAFGMKVHKMSTSQIKERVGKVLELVNLSGYEKRFPSQLSGGEQQRVVLARSIGYNPKLLLLDEPLANLDAKLRERMRHELREIQREIKTTMVYVTHDQSEALVLSDTIAVMDKGKIIQMGSPEEVVDSPATPAVALFIGDNNVLNNLEDLSCFGTTCRVVDVDLGVLDCGELRGEGEQYFAYFDASSLKLTDTPEGRNTWEGRVVRASRMGYQYDLSVMVGNKELKALIISQNKTIDKGDQILLSVDPESVKVQRWDEKHDQ